jgi:transglutaminase-like putative cysteine protease
MVTRARVLAPVALAALSITAGLCLGRLFDSSRYVLPVVGAAALPHVIGALGRRWRWPTALVLAVAAAALAGYVVWVLAPGATTAGLPLGHTWDEVGRRLSAGWHELRTARAPAPATDGAVLLAVLAVWGMAIVADWLAFTRRAALGALTPALVMFVWASYLGSSAFRAETVGAFTVFASVFLYEQGLALLDQRRSWFVTRTPAVHRVRGVAVLVVAAAAAAIAVAPALPGADAAALLRLRGAAARGTGGHTYTATVAPLVDVGAELHRSDVPDLFTVRAPVPDYWRVVALDRYSPVDGGQWTLQASGDGAVRSGLRGPVPAGALHQVYDIGPLGERWMPAAYRAVRISTQDVIVVTASATVVTTESSVRGLRYSVDSLPAARPGTVTSAQQRATAKPVPSSLRGDLALPSDFPADIRTLAETIVRDASASTPYAKAAALRDFFRDGSFVYDTSVALDESTNAIEQFLRDRRGFCVQFASAYAVMARAVGLPARLAVGYTPGTLQNRVYVVGSHDAHAWPEVWLAGLGWTHLFDPTPPAGSDGTGGSALPGDTGSDVASPSPTPSATVAPSPSAAAPSADANRSSGGSVSPAPNARPHVSTAGSSGGSSWWRLLAVVVAAMCALAAAYVLAVVAAKRRRRARRRAQEPAAAIAGAWEEALDRLREARLTPDPALTPIELARTAPARVAEAAGASMRTLARSYTTAAYGDRRPAPADAEAAWSALERLEHALLAPRSTAERLRRRLDPSPLRRPTSRV